MRSLRRKREPRLTVDGARLLIYVHLHLEDDFAACRRLSELRQNGAPASEVSAEALTRARLIAYMIQGAELMRNHPTEPLLESIPSHQDPAGAFMALTEVAAALTALVEEDVVEDALLIPQELDRLSDLYDLDEFSRTIRDQLTAALEKGGSLPDLGVEASMREAPYVEGGMTELRQVLLTPRTARDELRFDGMVLLLAHHGELYSELHRRLRDEGPSEELDALAVEAAVDIALLMQSLRREREILHAAFEMPVSPLVASLELDDLFRSFVLLTGRDDVERMAARDPDGILVTFEQLEPLREWLEVVGYEKSFLADAYRRLGKLRAVGATDAALLGRTVEWLEAGRVLGDAEESDAGSGL